MSGTPSLAEAAVGFAGRGWHVFPLRPGTKGRSANGGSAQLLPNGHKGASNDPEIAAQWWRHWPEANIGLSLAASGLVAVDIDAYKPECRWDAFIADREMPATFAQQSARGGCHLVFRAASDRRFAGRLCAGVDIKHKGYILLAPSRFDGRLYAITDDRPPATAPDWLDPPVKFSEAAKFDPCTQFPVAAPVHEVRELLDWIDPDLGYPDWIETLQGLHDHFGGSQEGLTVAEGWSSRGTKYVPGEVARKWSSFRAGAGVTLASIALRARQHGADLAEIARRHGATISTRSEVRSPSASADGDKFDLSHDALALALGRDRFDNDAKHVASQNLWYFWTGKFWQPDDALRSLTLTRAFLRHRADELRAQADDPSGRATIRTIDHLKSHATVSAVAALARANPASVARADDFDRDLHLLGTPEGVVDLSDGGLGPARREHLITRQTACGPTAPGVVPTRWLAFLHEIMDGDVERVAFLHRAAGYALTGSTAEHKLLFLHGSGRNGKSVFLNTLLDLWGSYGRRVPAATFLSGQVERHPTDLASLRGARLAVASELPRGKTWDEAVVKDLTGGDRMTARFMRQDFFEFDPQLTLMVAGNTQPSFRGVDEAIRARVVLVPFAITIPPEQRDPRLSETLRAEFPAILRWCIDGALAWQQQGLAVPDALLRASKCYFDDEDVIGQFLAEETVTDDPSAVTGAPDLILRFNQWADGQGLARWSQRSLVKDLKARGFDEGRRSRYRGLKGLRLR